ncbi:MAG: hypothetical protein ACYDGO_08640 [Smithellaceae bacterium]
MEENTDYQLSTSVNDGIVEVIIIGELTDKTLDKLRTEVITILRGKYAKAVLCDVRALKGPNEITTAYFRARSIPQDVKILPCAVVELKASPDYKSFYEITSANAGQTMKYFTDIEAARAWLKSRL